MQGSVAGPWRVRAEAMPLGSMKAQACHCMFRMRSTLMAVHQSY